MTNGNPPDLSYSEPDLRTMPPDNRYIDTDPRPERRDSARHRAFRDCCWASCCSSQAAAGGCGRGTSRPAPRRSSDCRTAARACRGGTQGAGVQHPIQSGPAETAADARRERQGHRGRVLPRRSTATRSRGSCVNQDFVRRFVVTVDNLPRKTYSQRLSPVKPTPGQFGVTRAGDQIAHLAAEPRALRARGAHARRGELGKARRAVRALLPAVPGSVQGAGLPERVLQRPPGRGARRDDRDARIARPTRGGAAEGVLRVRGPFAGVAARPGQKIMLRMGPENAARVKVKLKEIRALVAKEGRGHEGGGEKSVSGLGRPAEGGGAAGSR